MAVRTLALVGCALFACVLVGYSQVPAPPASGITAPGVVSIPKIDPPVAYMTVSVPQSPPPKTVDQLISDLTELRRQKAELEKKEQAVAAELRLKLKEQQTRLTKLGIEPTPAPQQVPIAPEGAAATGAASIPVALPPAGDR